MRIRLLILLISMGVLLWAGAEELRRPVVGVLPDHVDGSGCEFTRFDAPDGALPVFYAGGIEGAYMNIHGRIITLPPIDNRDTDRFWYYGTNSVKVIMDLGKPYVPDDTYEHASMTVIEKGQKTVLRVKGWCEC